MSESKNVAPAIPHGLANGDSIKASIKYDVSKDNYLSVLERQIEGLEVNHSR